ncbi:hypothetical protein VCV18_012272 [Metarhizium anisopliae]
MSVTLCGVRWSYWGIRLHTERDRTAGLYIGSAYVTVHDVVRTTCLRPRRHWVRRDVGDWLQSVTMMHWLNDTGLNTVKETKQGNFKVTILDNTKTWEAFGRYPAKLRPRNLSAEM